MTEEKPVIKPVIKGEINPSQKTQMLTKEDIMFELDVDGKAIPQKIEVEIYDTVYDDELILTTMELDNALTIHESLKASLKRKKPSMVAEIDKLKSKIKSLGESTGEEDKSPELNQLKSELAKKEKEFGEYADKHDMQVEAYKKKISELRDEINYLESEKDKQKEIKFIEASPCFVAEAYRYFEKHQWKSSDWTEENNRWENPKFENDQGYISHLLAEKLTNPHLTVIEWDKVKPPFAARIKDKLAEISNYHRPSPKEVLVERRRSEQLKNIIGGSPK